MKSIIKKIIPAVQYYDDIWNVSVMNTPHIVWGAHGRFVISLAGLPPFSASDCR
jgi:hypothetical protein